MFLSSRRVASASGHLDQVLRVHAAFGHPGLDQPDAGSVELLLGHAGRGIDPASQRPLVLTTLPFYSGSCFLKQASGIWLQLKMKTR